MWDDYYEPTEFDEAMEEFKASIVDNVRQEIKDKIDRLEKENAELREVKNNWKQIQAEHERAMRELRREKEQAKKQAEQARLQTVFRDLCTTGYRPSHKYLQGPKCDKCDENRKIHFVSPMGRNMQENCLCAESKAFYSPSETQMFSFYIGKNVRTRYYSRHDDNDYDRYDYINDYDRYDYIADVYPELPDDLQAVNDYRAVFLNLEDCQKYCDFKNEKNGFASDHPKEEER